MFDLVEVSLAQSKQSSAVEFCISFDVIVCVWGYRAATGVVPRLLRVVLAFKVDSFGAPVVFFTRDVIAAFEQQNLFAGRSQLICERASSGAGSDDDYVVMFCGHWFLPTWSRFGWLVDEEPETLQRRALNAGVGP